MREKLKIILFSILFVLIGFGIPYLVQFKWNFFGATLVTIGDILQLWLITPFLTFVALLLLYFRIFNK
jgi:uncharacterized membrane protein